MIAVLVGVLLVGVASGCLTVLLRPRGTIAVALCFAMVAFARSLSEARRRRADWAVLVSTVRFPV